MASFTVSVATEVLEQREGQWCRTCALPSGVTISLAVTIGSGEPRLSTFARCRDCGGDEIDL